MNELKLNEQREIQRKRHLNEVMDSYHLRNTKIYHTLKKIQAGYGHFNILIEIAGEEFGAITDNSGAVDVAFDDCYDNGNNDGRDYISREEAQEELVSEILQANKIEL